MTRSPSIRESALMSSSASPSHRVLLVALRAHVLEGQHGDRQLLTVRCHHATGNSDQTVQVPPDLRGAGVARPPFLGEQFLDTASSPGGRSSRHFLAGAGGSWTTAYR